MRRKCNGTAACTVLRLVPLPQAVATRSCPACPAQRDEQERRAIHQKLREFSQHATQGVVSVVRNCQHEITKVVSSCDTYSRARPNAQHVDRPRGTRCLGTAVTRQPGKTRVHFHPCKRNSVSENSVIEIVPSKNIDKIPSKRCIENSPPLQRRVRSLPGAVQRDAEVAHELKTNYPESRAARTRS
jgi:hypothetical protein